MHAQTLARQFIEEETAFHLGVLPTEQPHPDTRNLSQTFAGDAAAGVRQLLAVDQALVPAARSVMAGSALAALVAGLSAALQEGRRVFVTGCGATGRLSILLEAAWRKSWPVGDPHAERVISVMAGGDYALIRSVEGFEDFQQFGRRQLREAGVRSGDVVVAITEGGETPFVIGTAWEGLAAGAQVFFVFNNPADLLREHVQRSRAILDAPGVVALDLSAGPMAVAGSTRMQATTSELLVVGTALQIAREACGGERIASSPLAEPRPWHDRALAVVGQFESLLTALQRPENVATLAAYLTREAALYRQGGRVTYAADRYLLDLLTDTAERTPTFCLPPFRRQGDLQAVESWAFVKHPILPTPQAWAAVLGRAPRAVTWNATDYAALDAPERLVADPPSLSVAEIHRFAIGAEAAPDRWRGVPHAVVQLLAGEEWVRPAAEPIWAAGLPDRFMLRIGAPQAGVRGACYDLACPLPESPLALMGHLAVKLVMNTISTGTMAMLGRITGNWMSCVEPGNKKLIDRSTRLITALTGRDRLAACTRLFEAIAVVRELRQGGRPALSPVEWVLEQDGLRPVPPGIAGPRDE